LIPTLFVIVADPTAARTDLGREVARRYSQDPDCQTMANVWAIRTSAPPADVLAFIRGSGLVEEGAPVVVAAIATTWAAANAKREPDCWKGQGGWRLSNASGSTAAQPEYERSQNG
jgi:hypothetical protein